TAHLLVLGARHAALVNSARHHAGDEVHRVRGGAGLGVVTTDRVAGLGEQLHDAAAHGAGADDADGGGNGSGHGTGRKLMDGSARQRLVNAGLRFSGRLSVITPTAPSRRTSTGSVV